MRSRVHVAVAFRGPDADARQVVALLDTVGVPARLQSAVGGALPMWGSFDSLVVVADADLARAREFLDQSPRWRTVSDDDDDMAAAQSYWALAAAATVVGIAGLTLIAVVLFR